MSYEIRYTDEYGRRKVHRHQGSNASAKGWAEVISKDNGGRSATAMHIADGPYDRSGKETHLITVGDDK